MSFKKVAELQNGDLVNRTNEFDKTRDKWHKDIFYPLYIHEPVKLPKYVSDWIENIEKNVVDNYPYSDKKSIELAIAFEEKIEDKKISSWFFKDKLSTSKVAESILFGYEIEDEK